MGVTTQRSEFRQRVGRALGRNFYDISTTANGSTANQIVDPKRTERPAHWDGAAIKVGTEAEVFVRGGGGSINTGSGIIYLDRALTGSPANGTSYEIVKGWTMQDLADAIDWAHKNTWPHFYLPILDTTTVTEAANTISYTGAAAWQAITRVSREEIKGGVPAWYTEIIEDTDYRIVLDSTGSLVIELLYTPEAGRKVKVEGKQWMSIGSTDASTSIVPWEVIVPGALHYLYEKGISPDQMNAAMRAAFDKEAEKQLNLFKTRCVEFRMRSPRRRATFPFISESNIGNSVLH